MKAKQSPGNLVIVLLTIILLGTVRPISAQSVVKIGFVPSESFAPLFIAHERGHFKAQGLTTELVRLPSGAAILTQVSTGDLQVGGGALGAAGFNAAHQKLPVAFVAPMHYATTKTTWWFEKQRSMRVASRPSPTCAANPAPSTPKASQPNGCWTRCYKPAGLGSITSTLRQSRFRKCYLPWTMAPFYCGIITEPFATQAEEKGIGVRPLKAKPGAKPVPITVAFWNSDWAKKNDAAARGFMAGYLQAVRDLSEPNAWKAPVHTEIISKHTGVSANVLVKTRAPSFGPNLEVEEKVMMSQQEFNLRLGYLKYKEMKPIKELIDLSYAEAAVKQAGRK